MTPTLHTHTHN